MEFEETRRSRFRRWFYGKLQGDALDSDALKDSGWRGRLAMALRWLGV